MYSTAVTANDLLSTVLKAWKRRGNKPTVVGDSQPRGMGDYGKSSEMTF